LRAEDRIRVAHRVESARTVIRFVDGRSKADLESDEILLFALIRAVEILGEAAARVTRETQDANDHIPWASIIGMRNRLVHAYFDIDPDIVWETVTVDIPNLLPRLLELESAS
jgi:uncharacterized protein with HEPN domain